MRIASRTKTFNNTTVAVPSAIHLLAAATTTSFGFGPLSIENAPSPRCPSTPSTSSPLTDPLGRSIYSAGTTHLSFSIPVLLIPTTKDFLRVYVYNRLYNYLCSKPLRLAVRPVASLVTKQSQARSTSFELRDPSKELCSSSHLLHVIIRDLPVRVLRGAR